MRIEAAGGTGSRRRRFARGGRTFAAAAVVLLLAVQLAVAAHTHPKSLVPSDDGCAQLTVDSSLCPLCLLAFHLPLNPVSSAGLALPPAEAHAAPVRPEPAFHPFVRISCPPRGPPLLA